MSPRLTLQACAVALALTVPLAACGKLGQLERPGPLNGVESATTQQADERVRQATDRDRPVDTIDPRDQVTDPRPPRTLPIEGTNPDPNALPPPAVLPNPYANPPR